MLHKGQVVLIIEICCNNILESYYYHFTVQLVQASQDPQGPEFAVGYSSAETWL